ncbi:DUF2523 domain-containing protein [Photobacterium sp. SDRW27]|uniref:DUF2523 family protein n=1 Tax=Photobacterium obscurum TaxID=2829490 RepID=UPI0022430A4B|nr:DUF2523 family protein [Photobacterium obscurum]MCW8329401.1 DUF2523 domain-containing protein [Photobacterium obscurum]
MFDWIVDLYNTLLIYLSNLVVSLVTMISDMLLALFEQMLVAAKGLISLISDMLSPIDISQYLSGLPPSVAWVMSQIGLPQALAMIITAITIRLLLQLIPFVRLGS